MILLKKFFSYIGIFSLLLFTFFYTEKTVSVVKEYDDIMIEIKNINDEYKIDAKDALINDNTIIPGLKGKEIDINKSYSKMKRYGSFNSNLLIYKEIFPTISIKESFNKFVISGNSEKRMVSFIFLVEYDDNIDNIVTILDKKNIKGNFFINSDWLEKNNDLVISLMNEGHNIGNLSNNYNYQDNLYTWADTIIRKIGKQDISYCYSENENIEILKICSLYNNYTIIPSVIVKDYPLKEVKEQLLPGSIISFEVNNNLTNELELIINFIENKGLSITNLKEHLSE